MKETLEAAAEKYSENWEEITGLDYENSIPFEVNKIDFINGAKWQSERMFTEEDIKLAFIEGHNICRCVTDNKEEAIECFEEWFSQFKKEQ